jgi:hypothetical protein
MARPKTVIDEGQIRALMRLKPTLEDTAAFFKCSARTIERFIEKKFKLSFVEFREQNMVHTRLNLIRKAISKAESGDNTMLIFSLKNLCNWRDKQPGEEDKTIINNFSSMSDEQIEERIKKLQGEK